MGFFKKKKKEETVNETVKKDDALRDDISKAYDEIMSGGAADKPNTEEKKTEPENTGDLSEELLKSRIKIFKERQKEFANGNKTAIAEANKALIEVLKMLPGRIFLIPSVSNMEKPFETVDGKPKLKEGAVINPALLSSQDKAFLPVFTSEKEMTQKSPSGIVLKSAFEQCAAMVTDEKNPIFAMAINPFTDNMIIGGDMILQMFKKVEKNPKE